MENNEPTQIQEGITRLKCMIELNAPPEQAEGEDFDAWVVRVNQHYKEKSSTERMNKIDATLFAMLDELIQGEENV